jgi:hypothetical protein
VSTSNQPNAQVSRRGFLSAGFLGLCGLTLADVLRARAAQAAAARPVKDTSVLLVWLGGGASHIDMWDLKPSAPAEIRGEFQPIATSLPGVDISEHLPLSAKEMDKCALLRTVSHRDSDHASASHYLLTGYEPTSGLPANEMPSYGSIVARERGPRRAKLPAYVAIPEPPRSGMASYLGAAYDPFAVGGDPAQDGYSVRNLTLPDDVGLERLEDRRQLLGAIDDLRRHQDRAAQAAKRDAFNQKAFEMLTGPDTQAAFDLGREDARVRDRYGRTTFGQGLLLGRRLVEAGVTFVTVKNNGWDTHSDNFNTLKNNKLPELDRAWTALLQDVHERGLQRNVLVILLTEFGRSWFINRGNAGREHWPQCNSVLLTGGGLRMGQVIGTSDARAAYPKDRPLAPEDLLATMYQVLGINPNIEYLNETRRPIKILGSGKPIEELVG